jgi:hypothetical protein
MEEAPSFLLDTRSLQNEIGEERNADADTTCSRASLLPTVKGGV